MNNQNPVRVFSGVQPSGAQVHLGNYFGAMKRFVTLSKQCETECETESETKCETIFCIVDLHALTSVSNPESLRTNTRSLAAAYIAIGLDPDETILFKQSDIPEVAELCWYLACQFPLGLLERAHSVKDARAKELPINSGVMYYPILMAADILLYRATKIPVGPDQKQHLEMAREVRNKFVNTYGDVFPEPEPLIEESLGLIPGLDGRKMSKSYGNYIGLFESSKEVKAKISRIVTDSKAVDDIKDPETCNIFGLYRLLATPAEQQELREGYLKGGLGYGHAKQMLFEVFEREIGTMRDKYTTLIAQPEYLDEILTRGAQKARVIALDTIAAVRRAVGVW